MTQKVGISSVDRALDAGCNYAAFLAFCHECGLSVGKAQDEWRAYRSERKLRVRPEKSPSADVSA